MRKRLQPRRVLHSLIGRGRGRQARNAPYLLIGLSLSVLAGPRHAGAQAEPKAPAQPPQPFHRIYQPPPDLRHDLTLYLIGYSHLDTEWRWAYPQVIRDFLPKTLNDNFALFNKYPNYLFNWTGSNRYRLIQEYYPAAFQKLKQYIGLGRWFPAGSCVEEGDVDSPSEESIIRQVLYANDYFRQQFGIASNEFMIPDCFGFPASLPSILAHCGLKGFSTQKLTWGSAVGIPFNVGVWVGPDGSSVEAALNPGAYDSGISDDLSHDLHWIRRVKQDGVKSGVYADYHYYGTGDTGGAPGEVSVQWMERSLVGGGPLQVRSSRASDLFNDITPAERKDLPRYKGDLLLTQHSCGSITSEAYQKRWNHENEELADATERASVAADWLGALPYDKRRITDAWLRFLPGQFHDIQAGTAIPLAYKYSWNDQILALNEFAGVLREAIGGVARALNTETTGQPLVVYNPLSIARQDIVTASVRFPGPPPKYVRVFGPDGRETPSQIKRRMAHALKVLFLASVRPVSFSVFDVRASAAPCRMAAGLSARNGVLQNARYRVWIDSSGDISSIYDRAARRELLKAPVRLAFLYENPSQYPAWNMDWADQSRPPRDYVHGPATIRVVENGPARVALRISRETEGSEFIQTVRLAAGDAGSRVEIANRIDWRSSQCALKAVLPLTISNPEATYNWELGTVQRGNDGPKKYEVPSHEWFDLTNRAGDYGVSVLTFAKYGSDKPDDSTLRLTLLYTPGVRGGYADQATQDWGRHRITYAIAGHAGDWRRGQTQWAAMRFNQPLRAFQTPRRRGALGRAFSLLQVSTPQVSVEALKMAEAGRDLIVRFNELDGRPARDVRLRMAAPIISAREVNGQEQPIGPAEIRNGDLVFQTGAYHPRAYEIRLGTAPLRITPPVSHPLSLPFNTRVARARVDHGEDSAAASLAGLRGARSLGNVVSGHFGPAAASATWFTSTGEAIPAGQLPGRIRCDGVDFTLAGAKGSDAVACRGQTLLLPPGKDRTLYLLAAAEGGDRKAVLLLGGRPTTLSVQNWDGEIGQWDSRIWGDGDRTPTGLAPGYIKRARVAWYADHVRLADGSVDPYHFCYLFRYALALPDGVDEVRLPEDASVRIMAATVAQDPDAGTQPAQPLYDTLTGPGGSDAPAILPAARSVDDAVQVTLHPPLYYSGPLRYTLDGRDPSPDSPIYTGPFWLVRTATVTAAAPEPDGRFGPAASERIVVKDTTPPKLVSASAAAGLPLITLRFSEPVGAASAERPGSYRLSPGVAVEAAQLQPDGLTIVLRLSRDLPAKGAEIVAAGVQDAAGNPAGSAAHARATIIAPVLDLQETMTFGLGRGGMDEPLPASFSTAADAPWSLSLWVHPADQPQGFDMLASLGRRFGHMRAIGYFRGSYRFFGGGSQAAGEGPFQPGAWQMITASFDGQTLSLYRNGELMTASPAAMEDVDPVLRLAPEPFRRSGPGSQSRPGFTGKMRDVMLWNGALNGPEIQALFKQQLAVSNR